MAHQSKAADSHTHFIIVTGLSGSGKSTVLKALEDLGYYAVDNLPVELLPSLVKLPLGAGRQPIKVALGMDVRDPAFVDSFPGIYEKLIRDGWFMDLLFLEANSRALIRRYSETRRKHPLSNDQDNVQQVLEKERQLLEPVKDQASHVIDTSRHTVHDLRREVHNLFNDISGPAHFKINLMSFGFKHGVPNEADLMVDVRFLKNPYFVPELRAKNGQDPEVRDYVFKDPNTMQFLDRYLDLLNFSIPLYQAEGKTRLTIAVGCTGGHHRSVTLVEWLRERLKRADRQVVLRHRDIEI